MVQYIGYSSVNACKARTTTLTPRDSTVLGRDSLIVTNGFTLVDEQIVIQDFINALNIRKGQKVGQPAYGTNLWDFVFEPNDSTTVQQVEAELIRVAAQDPRLQINILSSSPRDNGILFEMEMAARPFNQVQLFNLFINRQTNTASIV